MKNEKRVEITAEGLVQGVGFRWFISQNAKSLGVNGYVENLMSGEVHAVAEGEKEKLEQLIEKIKVGPSSANVKDVNIKWREPQNEFTSFEIKH